MGAGGGGRQAGGGRGGALAGERKGRGGRGSFGVNQTERPPSCAALAKGQSPLRVHQRGPVAAPAARASAASACGGPARHVAGAKSAVTPRVAPRADAASQRAGARLTASVGLTRPRRLVGTSHELGPLPAPGRPRPAFATRQRLERVGLRPVPRVRGQAQPENAELEVPYGTRRAPAGSIFLWAI